MQPEHIHVLGLERAGAVERHDLHHLRPEQIGLLVLAQAEVGDRRNVPGELARRRLGGAPRVRAGELAEARERPQALHHVGLGGEQLLAAEPEPVNQPVHVEVGARRVDRRHARAIQLEEPADPLARLGRHLRGLHRGHERRHHVELAPARDLRAARDVDRAQLDRRARQRPNHGGRVGRVGQEPQPREHVADLGAPEERRLADHAVRHRALLERHRDRLALARDRRHEHGDLPRRHPLAGDQPLDVGGHRLRLGALVRASPERDSRPRPPSARTRMPPRPWRRAAPGAGRAGSARA